MTIPFTLSVICINVRADLKYTNFTSTQYTRIPVPTPHYIHKRHSIRGRAFTLTVTYFVQASKNCIKCETMLLAASFKHIYISVKK